jgi:predicted dehydrogenase
MRKVKMGMVGGGQGAFIGAVHRMAAALDGEIELVCGAFSSDAIKSADSGRELYLAPERVYSSYTEMFDKEADLPEGERMDFVSIVAPNHVHYPVASAALKSGFHVMSDKPATFTVKEAEQLEQELEQSGLLYGLTHNYTGYPMVKEARQMIAKGALGKVRKVVAEYPQGWLSTHLESSGQKQAAWRTNPQKSGISGCMGDIGSHAENLLEYITGLEITEVCADLSTFVDGRLLDDDGNVLIHMNNGAKGVLYASQISAGEENGPQIRVYGEKGSLAWDQLNPNRLELKWLDQPMQVLTPGANYGYYSDITQQNTRLPAGHPEGYLEAFANLYKNFATQIRCRVQKTKAPEVCMDVPSIRDGIRGMKFIKAVVDSSTQRSWLKL